MLHDPYTEHNMHHTGPETNYAVFIGGLADDPNTPIYRVFRLRPWESIFEGTSEECYTELERLQAMEQELRG